MPLLAGRPVYRQAQVQCPSSDDENLTTWLAQFTGCRPYFRDRGASVLRESSAGVIVWLPVVLQFGPADSSI